MIKGIIFDLDDTLYNASFCYKCGLEAIALYSEKNLNISPGDFDQKFSIARKNVKERLGNVAASHNRLLYIQNFLEQIGESPVVHALEMYNLYWDIVLESARLYEYVIPLFDFLKGKGIKIAILSDLTSHIQHRKILKLGLEEYVDVLVTSEEVGVEKPCAAMFEAVIDKLNAKAEELIMVGDSPERDITGSEAVGIKALIYGSKINVEREVRQYL